MSARIPRDGNRLHRRPLIHRTGLQFLASEGDSPCPQGTGNQPTVPLWDVSLLGRSHVRRQQSLAAGGRRGGGESGRLFRSQSERPAPQGYAGSPAGDYDAPPAPQEVGPSSWVRHEPPQPGYVYGPPPGLRPHPSRHPWRWHPNPECGAHPPPGYGYGVPPADTRVIGSLPLSQTAYAPLAWQNANALPSIEQQHNPIQDAAYEKQHYYRPPPYWH